MTTIDVRADRFGGQQATHPDPRLLRLHRPVVRDVPYVPTDPAVVAAMLRFAAVTPNDVLYDLGCGDGRIVIAAAKHYGARAVGIDIDPLRIAESRENAAKARVTDRVQFLCRSFFDVDLRDATVVTLYLLPAINRQLRPKLVSDLRPGARIVANYFDMGDWYPDMQAHAHHRVLHQWIVPAWVAGEWACVVNAPPPDAPHRRRHRMTLHLRRRYQAVTGTARLAGRDLPIINGRLFGDHLTFKLIDPRRPSPTTRFACTVEGNCLRGTCQLNGLEGPESPTIAWAGFWRSPAATPHKP